MSVLLETSLGDLTVDLFVDLAPKASLNFRQMTARTGGSTRAHQMKLCKLKYFNDQAFSRLQKGFVLECGDPYLPAGVGPASATPSAVTAAAAGSDASAPPPPARLAASRGGDSVWGLLYGAQARCFPHEPTKLLSHRARGTLTMLPVVGSTALHASTFALTLSDDLTYLDATCAPFGRVVEGLDEFITRLGGILTDPSTHQPRQNIRIRHTLVLEDPFPDPGGAAFAALVPPASPTPLIHPFDVEVLAEEETLEAERLRTLGEEAVEAEREKAEARSKAVVLEMLGDLPDADAEPPPNVLFVCKLNSITRSDDLELIFSRFGTILSCEVIRDNKTNASLQYAFIEFEDAKACEQAYFKMNNTLIDERRIKVDFSQSVSKQWNQMRRNKALKAAGGVAKPATTATAALSAARAAAPVAPASAASSAAAARPSPAAAPAVAASPAVPAASSSSSSARRSRSRSPPRSSAASSSSSSRARHSRSPARHHRSRSRSRSRRSRSRERSSRDHGSREHRRGDDEHRHRSSASSSSRRRSRTRSRSRSPPRRRSRSPQRDGERRDRERRRSRSRDRSPRRDSQRDRR